MAAKSVIVPENKEPKSDTFENANASASGKADDGVDAAVTEDAFTVVPVENHIGEVTYEICPDNIYNEITNAEALFRNSPNIYVVQKDLLSLEKFIFNQQHLQNNLGRLEFEVIAKWRVYVKLHGGCEALHLETSWCRQLLDKTKWHRDQTVKNSC